MGIEEKNIMEENTEQEHNEKQEHSEEQKNNENKGKGKKQKKASRGLQRVLFFLQHIALAVTVIALLVVVGSSTIQVYGFRSAAGFHMYSMYSQDQNTSYEDSDMFNTLFQFALSDIVRQGVVSSQLETGSRFDGKKVIDITAFNYRESRLPEQYVTAEYYLEDLLKWANHGFEWSSTQMTQSQARKFLANKTSVTIVDRNSQYYNASNASYLKSDIGTYTFVSDVSANQLWIDVDDHVRLVDEYPIEYTDSGEIIIKEDLMDAANTENPTDEDTLSTYSVFVNRYKTVENKNLEEYVSDWELYYDLCNNVQNAAEELAYNYNEYLECSEYYNRANSNVRYMIMKTIGEDVQIYTNLTNQSEYDNVAANMMTGDVSEGLLQNTPDQYIYYSPVDMVYRTNTGMTEDKVRQIFKEYDYAYPETVKIWMSVDSTYPADDEFRQAAIGYNDFKPYLWQGVGVAAAAGILYLVIFLYLTCVTGKDVDEEGGLYIRLNSFDKVPTEAAILLAGGIAVLAAWIFSVLTEIMPKVNYYYSLTWAKAVVEGQWFGVALAVCVFVADLLAMLFFYSLVRRIRAKTLWSNSVLHTIIRRMTRFAWKVYDNGDIVLRTWIPYTVFLLINCILFLFVFIFAEDREGFGLFISLIFVAAVDIPTGIFIFRNAKEQRNIVEGIETIAGGQLDHQVSTENLHGNNLTLANSVNSIGNGIKEAVEISMKDERMKADLITNVSHDIKTPLTSIINYVDLIKREQVDNEKVQNYIKVLDEKSQRLKQLTDDLVEASKVSSGNINLNFEKINLAELMNQTIGEFSEKFELKKLTTVMNINVQSAVIEADSRRIWRVIENLFNNIIKYAMEGTRVYMTIESLPDKTGYVVLTVKNISASPLNCDPEELTERFIRGDESRTTEGSGLGLSIAKNLTEAQKGTFEIQLDGDLFKVILTFPLAS